MKAYRPIPILLCLPLLAGFESVAQDRVPVAPHPQPDRWVEGRVALPSDSPSDDSLTVVALADAELDAGDARSELDSTGKRSWQEHPVLARAPVAPDGTFRLELPLPSEDDRPRVLLDLDGRFLFLPEPLPLEGSAADQAGTVLKPELGGAIRGTLELPEGTDEIPAITRVGAFGMDRNGEGMSRVVALENGLEFELRALRPGEHYTLSASFDIYPGIVHQEEVVEAGRWTQARIPVERGATVRGQVLSVAGTPLEGVEVSGNSGSSYMRHLGAGRAISDEQGSFELRGLAAHTQTLSAWTEGFLDTETEELQLSEAQVLEGVQIVLDEGLELSGTVRWPDGKAAVGARLTVIPLDLSGGGWRIYERAKSEEGSGRSTEDGTFVVGALQSGNYGVYVELAGRDDAPESSPWTARLQSVEAGSADLELTLSAPLSCTGLVLDDAGQTVESFTVTAQRADWPTWIEGPSHEIEATFYEAAGQFELSGLDRGNWVLSAWSPTHLRSEDRSVTLPTDGLDPMVLTRTATFSGTVLDPAGQPVAGAEVRAMAHSPGGRSGSVESDEHGRFTVNSVGPGTLMVNVESMHWAPSAERRLDLQPGEERSEESLHLTTGGALTGIIYNRRGEPDAGRTIGIQSSQGDAHELKSDENGRFSAQHLPPGPYQIMAAPESDDWMFSGPDDRDLGDVFEEVSMTMATVAQDTTVEIVLGAPPRAPVAMHGRILRNGDTVARAEIMALVENGTFLEGMRIDTADEDGRYELQLDEPGDYTFVIMGSTEHHSEVEFQVTIPEVDHHELDFEIPSGSIEGRVLAHDGSSPQGAVLWIQREDGVSDLSGLIGGGAESLEEDGSFLIEDLHPGRYALTATSHEAGISTVHDVLVDEGERSSGIEVSLTEAGRISGTVTDEAGLTVPGAQVLLRDVEGRWLFHLEAQADYDGNFTLERVPVGEVFVSACLQDRVSLDSAPTRVLAGEEVQVELELRTGVVLHVVLEDQDGKPMRAAVRVQNEAGHDHAGWTSPDELERIAASGVSSTRRRVGPLPPGNYRVQATAIDGRSAAHVVTLDGETGEQEVRIRLGN